MSYNLSSSVHKSLTPSLQDALMAVDDQAEMLTLMRQTKPPVKEDDHKC